MLIVPKVAECDSYMPETALLYATDRCEIQLLDIVSDSWMDLATSLGTREITLHLPFDCMDAEVALICSDKRRMINEFVRRALEFVDQTGLQVTLLFHLSCSEAHARAYNLYERFRFLTDSGMPVLLENTFATLERDYDGILYVLERFNNPREAGMCLDLCHLQTSNNVLQRETFNPRLLPYIKQIHFHYCPGHNGHIDKDNTHSQVHPSLMTCLMDLVYLESLGIHIRDMRMVTEIIEKDYVHRPNMEKEIHYLEQLQKGFFRV